MRPILTALTAILVLGSAPAMALVFEPPDSPPPPQMTPAELEARRAQEQSSAVQQSTPVPAIPLTPSARGVQVRPESNASASQLVRAVGGDSENIPADKLQPPSEREEQQDKGRRRGILLMVTSAAGMLGLGAGRLAMNALSRTSAKEAEQAATPPSTHEDDRSRSLGGDHREYFID